MKGLAKHTAVIFNAISNLECIRPFLLVGETALALQLDHRLSEDLDFMKWRTSAQEKMEVDWAWIRKELESVASIQNMNLMDIDHVEFILEGVKVSFYASPKYLPVTEPVHVLNNVYAADLLAIGAMKMEVLLRRSTFRDYYDIFVLLQHDIPFTKMVNAALEYSRHNLHTKNLYAMLTNGSRFCQDSYFEQLCPKYTVTSSDTESFFRQLILKQ
ncbi:MAG: nucleotidyl transferase AbiEii/AbiGii toxin family protein [Bacteroidales bacterium]|nr:nucleotidyl transferase AbiEii/AbiGii toxin family protein [Bacteroidales bacterium]